jgi:hypothetical protein
MSEPGLRIELERDILDGPLMTRMNSYSAAEFEEFVVERCSDPYRRAMVYDNEELVHFVENAYSGTGATIERKIAGLDDIAYNQLKALYGARPLSRHHPMGLSGPEFAELVKITITHGGIFAPFAPMLIKATRDVIIKWMDGLGRKRVKISIGPGKYIEITGPIDDKKMKEVAAFLQDAISSAKKPDAPPKKARRDRKDKR